MTAAAEQYRRRADSFEHLIAATRPDRWDRPSPCEGWTARDVVVHVVEAPLQDRVLGLLGRDPGWRPPAP